MQPQKQNKNIVKTAIPTGNMTSCNNETNLKMSNNIIQANQDRLPLPTNRQSPPLPSINCIKITLLITITVKIYVCTIIVTSFFMQMTYKLQYLYFWFWHNIHKKQCASHSIIYILLYTLFIYCTIIKSLNLGTAFGQKMGRFTYKKFTKILHILTVQISQEIISNI